MSILEASSGGTPFVGRAAERAAIDHLLDDVRHGAGGALLLCGPAGMGKSALLADAVGRAVDLRMLRAAGVESEIGLAFAGVHQVVAPILEHFDALPAPQRAALDAALGRAPRAEVDAFLVGVAVLTLLAEAARDQPVLVVVDDAQWLDGESASALAFVGRRVHADAVGLLVGIRASPHEHSPFDGIPSLEITGLTAADARTLLLATTESVDDGVADRIVSASAGIPLALVELPAALAAEQLRGATPLPDPLPIGDRLSDLFAARVDSLDASARALLVLVATERMGDSTLLRRAAAGLGIAWDSAAASAEATGLATFGPVVQLRHPLVRSVLYYSALPAQRRAAHAALADALDADGDADRRAWHIGAATSEPDEYVASALESAAERSKSRGGWSAAAAHLLRAAELTPDPARAAVRFLDAARAELTTGHRQRAQQLLARANARGLGPEQSADAAWTHALVHLVGGEVSEAARLLAVALPMAEDDSHFARGCRVAACAASLDGGHLLDETTRLSIADALRPRTAGAPGDAIAQLVAGIAARLQHGGVAALPTLHAALTGAARRPDHFLATAGDHVHVVYFDAILVAVEALDDRAWDELTRRWVEVARRSGAVAALPLALGLRGWLEVVQGRLGTAASHLAEADDVAALAGSRGLLGRPVPAQVLRQAWLGDEAATRTDVRRMMREGHERGQGISIDHAYAALTVLELGSGRYEAALRAARRVVDHDGVGLGALALADVVEAAVRCGDAETAGHALRRLSGRVAAASTPWARGLLARAEAVAATGDEADERFRCAIDELARTTMATDTARAQLLHGEWLRRARRRRDARERLYEALEHFEAIAAAGFAARARAELVATGEHLRTRVTPVDVLTPQESQIARLAAAGERNRDIAEHLYITTSTVEYHLRKVFVKLGVTSRTQLAQVQLPR